MRKALPLALLVLSLAACPKKKATTPTTQPTTLQAGSDAPEELRIPKVDPSLCDTTNKRVVASDLNKDGSPEVWKLYASVNEGGTNREYLACKQIDADHDSKKDFVATFDEAGVPITEDYDWDYDGHFDARGHFDKKSGRRVLVERDTINYDGKFDLWVKYDGNGNVESIRRDRGGDPRPDYWEQYKDGVLDKILYDEDYDGRVDFQEEATPAPAPPLVEPPATTPASAPASAPSAPASAPSAPASAPSTASAPSG